MIKRNKMDPKYKPKELFLEEYNYDGLSENEESSDTTLKSDKEIMQREMMKNLLIYHQCHH